ncbi:MAG: hypothetical protein WCF67_16670 [Chitinophagaceae bacterium]
MADCNFSISFSGTAANLVAQMQTQIEKQGGSFNGDENSGTFSVKVLGSSIEGSYTITGSELNVVITDKPFFIGCGQIESFLKSHIGQ